MSEPRATAKRIDQVAPGLWRWHVLDERIGSESDAYAVRDGRRDGADRSAAAWP